MTPSDHDPFYVGYHPTATAPIARSVRRRVVVLGLLVLGSAVLLAFAQRRADPGVFEYGHPQSLQGQIREFPYPSVLVPRPGLTDREAAYTRYLLVAEGKHGAQSLVAGLDGQWVNLHGTRIARPEREMLEVTSAGVASASPAPNGRPGTPVPSIERLGRLTLEGEIVDSKCWLGVMKPATGTVHRGCASRCLSGGIPPLLITVDSAGSAAHYLLTYAEDRPAHAWFADLVGRRVRLTGEVWREGDLSLMRVEKTVVVW
jgi:hypothetical protein